MTTISVTGLIKDYRVFSRLFWLSYKALEAVMSKEEFEKIKITLMKSKWIDPKYLEKIDKEAYKLKLDEIDLEWKKKSEDARNAGIETHARIHEMLTNDASGCKYWFGIPTDLYQVLQTEKFLTESGIFSEFRLEKDLDEEYLLIGVADLIIKDGNNIKIIDFKSDEKIETTAYYDIGKHKKKCLKYPLSKFEDCALVLYLIQLSLYAWLIKQMNPEFNIQSLEIMHIKDGKLKKTYPVEYLEKDIENLLKWHLKAVRLKRETDKCKEIKY